MNKKILPFAVAGILAGAMGAAQAGVTLYGKVLVSIDAQDCDAGMMTNGGCNRGDSATTNGDDLLMASRSGFGAIGVKGSEDLGNGMNAIFQLEYGTNPADGAEFGGRDQWLGLQGGFGMVRMGTVTTNYKQSGAALDPFWRTSLDSRDAGRLSSLHSGKGEQGQGRATNTVRYDSPSFSGAKVVANYTLDSGLDSEDGFGIGVHYSAGAIFATFDYINNGVDGEDDAWKLGGKYSWGDAAFYGHYERGGLVTSLAGAGESDANMWHLGASYSLGGTMAYLAYGRGDRETGAANDQHVSWTLAVKHGLSNRTSVYGGFERLDRDVDGKRDLFTLGLVHNF